MAQGGKQTDLNPGVVARVAQAARYVISGVTPNAWFGPQQPIRPMAPESVAGRRFDYPTGYNLDTRPRGYEPISFDDLRTLADNCDVLRAVIETRKDQMESLDWMIRPKATGKGRQKPTSEQLKRADQVVAFFQRPDRESSWLQWQRQLLEDMFVIDAASIYKRLDRKGRLYGLDVIDGATIRPLLDETGRTPVAPDPAFQQILKGIPAVDYTRDELLYVPRNPRSWKVYGYSHVEQVVVTVNIAIRRALSQLEYYREGSQPDAFGSLPKEWSIDQIKAFQTHFDSMMAGNFANRRKLRFMPESFKYQETKQPPLKDQYDEWLARVICFVFSVSPDPFVTQVNRATAETSQDRSLQEGLKPLQRWVKGIIDPIIAEDFDSPDLEFAWIDDVEQDPKQAADIYVGYVNARVMAADEVREKIGLDPLGEEYARPFAESNGFEGFSESSDEEEVGQDNAEEGRVGQAGTAHPAGMPAKVSDIALNGAQIQALQQITQSVADGLLPAETAINLILISLPNIDRSEAESIINPAKDFEPERPEESIVEQTEAEPVDNDAEDGDEERDQTEKAAYTRLRKAARHKPIPFDRPVTRKSRTNLKRKVLTVLQETASAVAEQVRYELGRLAKDAIDDEINRQKAERISQTLDLSSLNTLVDVAPAELEAVLSDASRKVLAQMGVDDDAGLVDQVNERAVAYARDRAAEMIGKQVGPNGQLINNPDAEWRIDETTRSEIRTIIEEGLADNIGRDAIAEAIEGAAAFSEERAALIANTEIADANSQGVLEGYRAARDAGVKVRKAWLADAEACETCRANADAGAIDLDEKFPSGDDAPPGHPRCECALVPVVDEDN